MVLVDCAADVLSVQVTCAAWQPGDGWELTTETGRGGQKRRGQHSSLILADQMNVRKGASTLSAGHCAASVPVLALAGVPSDRRTALNVSGAADAKCL